MSMETESPAPLLQYSSVLRRHLQALQQLGAIHYPLYPCSSNSARSGTLTGKPITA